MARESKTKIAQRLTDKIERKFEKKQPVIDRMDKDYARYKMVPFVPDDEEAIDPEDAYTTNLDRVTADTAVGAIASAELIIRTVKDSQNEQRNTANENLEKFAIGVLNRVDEKLEARGELSVLDQLAWYAPIRSQHVVIRSLFTKDSRGESVPEMLPMDPRNFVFEKGDDELEWCAYRMVRTRDDIKARYPKFRFEQPAQNVADREVGEGMARETLYDYYETRRHTVSIPDPRTGEAITLTVKTYWNTVIVPLENKLAKPFHNTHAVHFPVIVRAAGLNPGIAPFVTLNDELGEEEVDDTLKEQGDSIFAPNRLITPFLNRIASLNMKLTALAADPPVRHQTVDGEASFDQSVFRPGTEVQTSAANQEEVDAIETPATGFDAAALLNRAVLDHSAGGLSPQARGEFPPGGLSAAALDRLGNDLGELIGPFLRPVVSCMRGAINAQIAQFETGSYRPIEVFGRTVANDAFEGPVSADQIQGHGILSVELVPRLPSDAQLKWITAQIAITPNAKGQQLTSPEYAREEILKIQDAALEDSRIRLDEAKSAAPVLALMEMMEAAQRAGDMMKVQYLQGRIQQLLLQEKIEFMALLQAFGMGMDGPLQVAAQGMSQNGGGGQQAARGPGARPEMASTQSFMGPFGASPTAGQNSTAARPGARTEQR